MFGGMGRNLSAVINSPELRSAFQQSAQGDQRRAFIAVLLAHAAEVSKKPNFNLELELNDLWNELTNLRQARAAGPSAGLSGLGAAAAQGIAPVNGALGDIIKRTLQNHRF